MKRHHLSLICLVVICMSFMSEAWGAKKDFKGLFGSYRREKFTENEGRSSDFGVDLMLSTLLPVTSVVKSAELNANPSSFSSLNYATFFNVEASFWLSLGYHWAIYTNIGRFAYETRKQHKYTIDDPAQDPQFHKFEMEAIPAVLGLRYRLSREDLVPYASVGIGMAYVHRRGENEASNLRDDEYTTIACGHGAVGVEFFFAPNAGLRVEASAFYFNLPQRVYVPPGSNLQLNPKLQYESNLWTVRYASGLFFLF